MGKLLLVAPLLLAACSAADDGPGTPATGAGDNRTYAVADFTGVEVRASDDVDVRVGTGFSVRAKETPDVLDQLSIERVGDTLRIGRRDRAGLSLGGRDSAKVFVTLPRLTDAAVSGSGDLAIDRVEGGAFAGAVAGSGSLAVAALGVDEAELSIAGSGDLSAAGTAKRLEASIAGSGSVEAPRLIATEAEVLIVGSGDVRAVVNGPASVSVMGSGDVDLGPGARCTTSRMGSGEVRCGG